MLLGACVTHRKTIKFAVNSLSEVGIVENCVPNL